MGCIRVSPHRLHYSHRSKIGQSVPTEKNKHVWDYLTYYISLAHAPGFAVLVSGRWGVGKTHLLKDFLKVTFEDDVTNHVYVSLHGLSSIEEIDDALFEAAFPVMTGTAAKIAARIAKASLKFLKVEPGDWNIKEFLNKFRAKVYVFDDLERCEAPINKVLGYINQFVEHGGAKVIILANEQEIGADEDYARRREKLIGKTLQVRSVFDEAFKHFVSNIDHAGARGFIEAAASDIATIYGQADLDKPNDASARPNVRCLGIPDHCLHWLLQSVSMGAVTDDQRGRLTTIA